MPYLSTKPYVDELKSRTRCMMRYLNDDDYFRKIAIIVTTKDPATKSYVNSKCKAMNNLGLDFQVFDWSDLSEHEIYKEFHRVQDNPLYTGIIVQRPLREDLEERAMDVLPNKDIDGLSPDTHYIPATAYGIDQMISQYAEERQWGRDKTFVILGQSKLVGKPLAHLLMDRGYTVISLNSKSKTPIRFLKEADVIISAIGKPHFLTKDMIGEPSLIIDVGTTLVDGKLQGDVHPDVALESNIQVTPVPGGVGPLTVESIIQNIILSKNTYQMWAPDVWDEMPALLHAALMDSLQGSMMDWPAVHWAIGQTVGCLSTALIEEMIQELEFSLAYPKINSIDYRDSCQTLKDQLIQEFAIRQAAIEANNA